MCKRRGVGEVVDRDEIDVLVAERGPHDVAADAPEPVDADFHCHRNPPIPKNDAELKGEF
jgi:hypothetical protein